MPDRRTAILSAARTPFGKFLGGLSELSATDLGARAIEGALTKAGVAADDVQHVVMGHVIQAGAGQITARQAAHKAGIPLEVSAETINKVCASAHRAVTLADLMIRAGDHDVVVAGGMESMSQAPHLAPGARRGYRMGEVTLVDSMIHDGLTDPFRHVHMVVNGAEVARELGISRERQDEWALRSHELAIRNRDRIAEELVPVTVRTRRGETVIDVDESPREDTSLESLAGLKPIFVKDGTATAGNSPGVNDGASALVLASEEWARERGIEPIGFIRGYAYVAGDSPYLAKMPGEATNKLLREQSLTIDDIAHVEFNEAFASVAVHAVDMTGIDPELVNVNGGAIALGHPIGASGARIIGTTVYELRRRGGGLGIAALCSGGGQGDAVLVEVA